MLFLKMDSFARAYPVLFKDELTMRRENWTMKMK